MTIEHSSTFLDKNGTLIKAAKEEEIVLLTHYVEVRKVTQIFYFAVILGPAI